MPFYYYYKNNNNNNNRFDLFYTPHLHKVWIKRIIILFFKEYENNWASIKITNDQNLKWF